MLVVVSYRKSPIMGFYAHGELSVTYGGRTIVSVNLPYGSVAKKLLTKNKVMSTDVVFTAQDFVRTMKTYAKLMDSDVEIVCTGDNAAVFLSASTQAELEAITAAVTKLVSELSTDASSILSTQSDALTYRLARCMADATSTCFATGDAVKYMATYLEGMSLGMYYVEALAIAMRAAYLGSDVVAHTLMRTGDADAKLCAWMSGATAMTLSISSAANARPIIRITGGSTLSADFIGELSPKAASMVHALGTSTFIAVVSLQADTAYNLRTYATFELSADALLKACYMSHLIASESGSLLSTATLTAEAPTPPEPTMYKIEFYDTLTFGSVAMSSNGVTYWYVNGTGANVYCQGFKFTNYEQSVEYRLSGSSSYFYVYYGGWYRYMYMTIYTTLSGYPSWHRDLKTFIRNNATITQV